MGFRRLTRFDGYSSSFFCTIVIGFSILVAFVMYRLIERPSMRLAERLKPARTAAESFVAKVPTVATAEG